MSTINGQTPQGPNLQPQKYPRVGPNYMKYGEQPGLRYDYARDAYFVDPNEYEETYADLKEPEPEQPGLFESLAPVAGTVGAIAGGKYVGEKVIPGLFEKGAEEGAKTVSEGGLFSGPTNATSSTTGAAQEIFPVGSHESGGTLMSDGSVVNEGWLGGPEWLASGDPLSGNASGILPYAGAAYGAYNLYDQFANPSDNKFGSALSGAASGAAIGSVVPGVGTAIGAGVGGLIGLGSSFTHHVSTKEQQGKNWDEIGRQIGNAPSASYVQGYQRHIEDPNNPEFWAPNHKQQWIDAGRPDPTQFRQQNMMKKFEDMNGLDLTPGAGFFQTFGNDWLDKFSEEQRIKIAEQAKNEGLVRSSRGDILVDNKDRLRQIGEEVWQQNATPMEETGQRSDTLSPGIGLDGKRISY